jgi:hypothetical protein
MCKWQINGSDSKADAAASDKWNERVREGRRSVRVAAKCTNVFQGLWYLRLDVHYSLLHDLRFDDYALYMTFYFSVITFYFLLFNDV